MTDNQEDTEQQTNTDHEEHHTYLCVIDDSAEVHQALRYACNRAKHTNGRIALLYVIEPAEFDHWMAVRDLMSQERREEAEEMLRVVSSTVQQRSGAMPVIYIREGDVMSEMFKLINDDDAGISVLVLGAATGGSGPGPLVTQLTQKMAGKVSIPITIVPGHMSDQEIDRIT